MQNQKNKQLSLLIISLFTLISCNQQEKTRPEQPLHKEKTQTVSAPKGIISIKTAKALCDNFQNTRIKNIPSLEKKLVQNQEKFIPTQFIDFDLATIKTYIKYIEQEAKKAKVKPDDLRIYLANYGQNGKAPNQNTVFILPTAKINGIHGGFFINSEGKAELIRNYKTSSLDTNNKKNLSSNLQQNQSSLILNDGNNGPPPFTDFN